MGLVSTEHHKDSTGFKPPQFRLQTMLVGVALLCALLVIMVSIGMFWAMGLLLLVLLICAHVIGNSLGTQLREHGSRLTIDESDTRRFSALGTALPSWQKPSAGRMQEKRPVGWLLIGLSAVGAIASGIVGGLSISSLYWEQINVGAIAIATLASGVMGGMAVFLAGNFIDMVQRVWREATTDTPPGKER